MAKKAVAKKGDAETMDKQGTQEGATIAARQNPSESELGSQAEIAEAETTSDAAAPSNSTSLPPAELNHSEWEPVGYSSSHEPVTSAAPTTAPLVPTEEGHEQEKFPDSEISTETESPLESPQSEPEPLKPAAHEFTESSDNQPLPPVKKPKRHRKLKRFLWFLLFLLVLAGLGAAGYGYKYWYLPHHQNQNKNQNDINVVVAEVARHVVLPTGEKPVMAAVTDKSKVTSPFLKEADYGDRVLVYAKAQKIIIYRPSIDRIIDIGHIQLPNQ